MTTIYSPSLKTYEEPISEPKGPQKLMTRIVLGMATFVVAVGIIVAAYFIFLGSSSVKGEVKEVNVRENTSIKPLPKNLSLRGQHFSISYGSTYANQDTHVRTNNTLESYSYVASTVYDKRMAVAVQKLPTGGLIEESSYKMRTIYPDKYSERKVKTANGTSALVMTKKTDGTNKESVLFVVNDTMLATVALVVTGGDDDLSKEIDQIAASFKWAK